MRDVRQVELPPLYQLDYKLLRPRTSELGKVGSPPENAPGVVVLDSGLASAHPLIGPVVGDSQGFSDNAAADDATGHGTAVAGLALYGDIETALSKAEFSPKVWLFSGRIVDGEGTEPSEFLENRVEKAVDYFKNTYGCRVYNLAFGDTRKPFTGGHVERFAATLDTIAREKEVLFVVSAGNFNGTEEFPQNWRTEDPNYLFSDEARIIDPAPALNVLTVGSLARHEGARMAVRFPDDPAYQPVARREEPSPFSRTGPGPLGAIKPELVEYGGNEHVDARSRLNRLAGNELGELTTSSSFAAGQLLEVNSGTSFAAAKVSYIATRILSDYPNASPNLLRALLIVHAEIGEGLVQRFENDEESLRRLVGYGRPVEEVSRSSTESRVTMYAEESLSVNEHQFYELPLPEDLFRGVVTRRRRISIALAHTPRVRGTRIDYKEAALSFRIVKARNINEVTQAYRRLTKGEKEPPISEQQGFCPSPRARDGGTVQCATRILKRVDQRHRDGPYFVVVTNSVPPWADQDAQEPYSLVVVIEDLSGEEVRLYTQV